MDRIGRELGNVDPLRRRGQTDITVDEMEMTVAQFYQPNGEEVVIRDLTLDTDLRDIFDGLKRNKSAIPAQTFLHQHRKSIVDKVAYWTGAQRPVIKKLVEAITHRAAELKLVANSSRESEHVVQISVYLTALAMNYMARGKFVQP